MSGTSRMTGDGHVRICERPGVKFPRPTRLLAEKLAERERRVMGYDEAIRSLFQTIRQLMTPPARERRAIGFKVEAPRPVYRRRRRGKPR